MLVPTHLTSSNLDVAGYRQGRLFIRFKSGCTYSYDHVPFECFQGARCRGLVRPVLPP